MALTSTCAGRAVKGVRSDRSAKAFHIGIAAASYCDIGCKPRMSSIVRSMLLVEYIVESTTPRFTQPPSTKPGMRCASTWSAPFCVSSSRTKIAVSFQNRERLTASTIMPSATSFSATIAVGVDFPARVPCVWSLPRRSTCRRGMPPSRSKRRNSEMKRSARFTSG